MNPLKKSLEEAKAEILKELPTEFHGDFEAECKRAAEHKAPTPAEELEAIKACARENPHVDDAALIPQIEKNPTAHRAAPPPSAEEQKKAIKAALAKVGELKAPPESA